MVAVSTMRLPSALGCQALASKDVFTVSDWLKVGRIAAPAISAKMIKLKAVIDRADQRLVSKAVRPPL
jgi:hypothetical protein